MRLSFIVILFIVFLVALLPSCSRQVSPIKTLNDLEKPFGVDSGPAQLMNPVYFNIFIDGTESMYGFTNENGELFHTINKIANKIPNNATTTFYKFGAKPTKMGSDFRTCLQLISQRNFYDQPTTDLSQPFDFIEQDPRASNSINLIFTDGLQSTPQADADLVNFSKRLHDFLGSNGYFSFMGKLAQFEGRYFSLKAGKYIDFGNTGKRPFYCLAFSNQKYADYLRDKVGKCFDDYTFDFGKIDENKLRYAFPPATSDAQGLEGRDSSVNENQALPLSVYSLRKNPKTLEISLKNYEERFGRNIQYQISYKAPEKGAVYKLVMPKPSDAQIRKIDENVLTIAIPNIINNNGDYLIRFAFRKSIPQWIVSWNTDDDSSIDNQSKTYKIKNWIDYILEKSESDESLVSTQYFVQITK